MKKDNIIAKDKEHLSFLIGKEILNQLESGFLGNIDISHINTTLIDFNQNLKNFTLVTKKNNNTLIAKNK